MPLSSFVLPGASLGPATDWSLGPGTHIQKSNVAASRKGRPEQASLQSQRSKPTICVEPISRPFSQIPSRNVTRGNTLPTVNCVVLAKVTRLQQRQANVTIMVVDNAVCSDEFAGVIRQEDVRGWEVDKVKIEEMFRVGDVVRAVVISLGDQASYYLSTARNDLGVLLATSDVNNQMYPVSWNAFRDPVTGKLEGRKVAKPV